jgi:hypothetical protein
MRVVLAALIYFPTPKKFCRCRRRETDWLDFDAYYYEVATQGRRGLVARGRRWTN